MSYTSKMIEDVKMSDIKKNSIIPQCTTSDEVVSAPVDIPSKKQCNGMLTNSAS